MDPPLRVLTPEGIRDAVLSAEAASAVLDVVSNHGYGLREIGAIAQQLPHGARFVVVGGQLKVSKLQSFATHLWHCHKLSHACMLNQSLLCCAVPVLVDSRYCCSLSAAGQA